MKKLAMLMIIISFLSCGEQAPDIYYFKDCKTNLCFARIISSNGLGNVNSIICVPCDSVEHVLEQEEKPKFTE